MRSQYVFTFAYRFRTGFYALLGLFSGVLMVIMPFRFFALLMLALPLLVWALGLWGVFVALKQRSRRKNYLAKLIISLLLISGAGLIFWKIQWRDVILWYLLAAYIFYSAWQLWRPVLARGVEKQVLWRSIGSLTAAVFGAFLLFMPRSDLALAVRILGGFLIVWGVFQLLLPSPRE